MTLNHNFGCFSGVGFGIAGNALFAQLERMADQDLDLEEESTRTKGIVALSQAIVNLAKEEINYHKLMGNIEENGNVGKFFDVGTKQIGN